MEWNEYTEKTGWGGSRFKSMGPIAWPTDGYIDNQGNQLSCGLRHPSSIVVEETVKGARSEHIYVYYLDTSKTSTGVKVARAEVKETIPNMEGYFKVYNGETGGFTENALPSGYETARIREFFTQKGPKSSPILETDFVQTCRFSVAKIFGTNLYLGVEEFLDFRYGDKPRDEIALRLSTDLVHWGPRRVILSFPNWQSGLNYPIFLRKDGSDNTIIDADEFYIVGGARRTTGTLSIYRIRGHLLD
jgi:hypothetical protein